MKARAIPCPHRPPTRVIYQSIYLSINIFFFHHTTCESTCDTLSSSAANQGDISIHLSIYIYIYIYI